MTRVLSALVLIPAVVGTIWLLPPIGTLVLALVASALAFVEYRKIANALGAPVSAGIGGTAVVLTCLTMAIAGASSDIVTFVLMAVFIVVGALTVGTIRPGPSVLASAAATVFGPIYVGLPLGALAAVRLSPSGDGTRMLLLLFVVIVVSDSAQYYTGRALGRRPLSPIISPKKTVEGAVGGVLFGTLAMAGLGQYIFNRSSLFTLVLLGAVISLLGIVGDLFESLLKRSANLKDSSNLIPGHGGVLDRIDSWLFAAPVYYVFVRFVAS